MAPITLWTDEFLESMRSVGDPIADGVVAEVYATGQAARVNELLRSFHENWAAVPTDLPPLLGQYLEQSAVLPTWADGARIERGNEILGRYAPHIVVILHCWSLPMCYGAANGVQVLYRTTRLHGQVFRRIMETAQFIIDVLDKGGLGDRGRGRRSAQKIRLLHAAIRDHLRRQPDWNPGWGLPINQEDLAGTLFSFSVAIPLGLGKLGVSLTRDDRDAFFHTWRVIGHLLGVDERLNPEQFESGVALTERILARQWAPSEAGRVVTRALLDYMQGMLANPLLAGAPPTLIRHLAGNQLADMLGVPPSDWTQLGLQLLSTLNVGLGLTVDNIPLASQLANQLGLLFLKGAVGATNFGQRYEWCIPQ